MKYEVNSCFHAFTTRCCDTVVDSYFSFIRIQALTVFSLIVAFAYRLFISKALIYSNSLRVSFLWWEGGKSSFKIMFVHIVLIKTSLKRFIVCEMIIVNINGVSYLLRLLLWCLRKLHSFCIESAGMSLRTETTRASIFINTSTDGRSRTHTIASTRSSESTPASLSCKLN